MIINVFESPHPRNCYRWNMCSWREARFLLLIILLTVSSGSTSFCSSPLFKKNILYNIYYIYIYYIHTHTHTYIVLVFSHVWLFESPWAIAHQAPLSMGVLQARILEWVTMPWSRASSQPRDQTGISWIAGRVFTSWAIREAHIYLNICVYAY